MDPQQLQEQVAPIAALADPVRRGPRSPQTLPRALADSDTLAGLRRLRDDGWLDWHILLAIANVAFNIRARAAGLLDRPLATEKDQRALAHSPETPNSEPIPLAALTPEALDQAMQLAVLAVAKRRWRLLSGTQTPNLAAFRALVATRCGFTDDVPHRDLLLSVEDLASLLQVPVKTIYQWRHRGDGPRPIRVGRYLRFDPNDVATWIKERREAS